MRKFLIFLILFCALAGSASAATVYVSADNSGDYNCDGTDDHIQINEALTYASEHSGTTVYLKGPATYWINSTITVPSETTLTGDSTVEVKLINSAGWARYVGLFEPLNRVGHDITISGFSIDGNIDNQAGVNAGQDYYTVLRMDNTTNLTVHDMYLHNSKNDGIRVLLNTFSEGVGHVNIYNNTINTCAHDGIYLWKVSYANIYNNSILPNTNSGIRADGSNHLRIYDNYIHVPTYTGGAGIYVLLGSTIMKANDVEIYNNLIEHTNLPGIAIAAYNNYNLADASDLKVHHNIVKNCGFYSGAAYNWGGGISIQGFNNTTVENNVVDGCYRSGIFLYDYYASIGYPRAVATYGFHFNTILKNNIIVGTIEHPSYSGSGAGVETWDATNYSVNINYNDIWNNAAGGYSNFSAGANDISADPLFLSATDYHLKSKGGYWNGVGWSRYRTTISPCIDAGDPTSTYSNEPSYNGGRINIGRYGNTVEASKSVFAIDTATKAFWYKFSQTFWITFQVVV